MIVRVRDRAQFNDFQSAPRVRYGSLTVRVAPSRQPGHPAVAYSVSRAVGNAVCRNRIRRQLRADIAASEQSLHPDSAYLITVHQDRTHRELGDALRECLARIGDR